MNAISTDNNMPDLLTARQVQTYLKVDRITVYRMLQDGRLKGVKIGQQWRFQRADVERMLSLPPQLEPEPAGSIFPIHCVQTIQDLFSNVSQVGALLLDRDGTPVTQTSNPCQFCQTVGAGQAAQQHCSAAWKTFVQQSHAGSKHFTCPAGLHYVGAPVVVDGDQVGLFLVGGFYWHSADPREQAERARRLAEAYQLSPEALQLAAERIPVIDPADQGRVEAWPFTAVRAIHSILQERTGFMQRLQRIADLTQIP